MTAHFSFLKLHLSPMRLGAWCCLGATISIGAVQAEPAPNGEAAAFFEKKIRPLLAEHCYECHSSGKKQKGGLVLDSKAGWEKGGETRPAIKPGEPEQSLLIQAIKWQDQDLRMPPEKAGGKMPDGLIADLVTWVKMGAPDPRVNAAANAVAGGKSWSEIFKERKQWWDLQPVRAVEPPKVDAAEWGDDPVDRFLRARMAHDGITPSGAADARTLIRRASMVLTGLPPSPEEVGRYLEAAERDRAGAFAAAVDRMLAAPQFGEHFARHWLDVVRFGETHGFEFNYDVPFAWRYRDYVIRAFNADLPYDQFVREQIAGDLLPRPRWNPVEHYNESAIGTAFYRFGEVTEQSCIQFPGFGYDFVDNQLDTLTKAFQATTVSCARCHDHKLDAISTKDYYGLVGILRSSRSVQRTLDGPEVNREPLAKLRALKGDLRAALAAVWRDEARAIDAAKLSRLAEAAQGKAPTSSDPLHAWYELFRPGQPPDVNAAEAWGKLGAGRTAESVRNAEFNRQKFTTIADFRNGSLNGWTADGMGLREGPGKSGDFAVATEGEAAVKAVLPAGVFTFALSDKLNGAFRSPTLMDLGPTVSFEVIGDRNSLARIVFNNCQLNDYKQTLHSSNWTWGTIGIGRGHDEMHPYAELVTFWDNPKFPEPQGVGGNDRKPWSEAAKNPRTWWGVRRIVRHAGTETPKDELTHLERLFSGPAPATAAAAARVYARVATEAVEAFAADRATDDDVVWLSWMLENRLLTNRADASARLAQLTTQYRVIEAQLSLPHTMPGLADEGDGFAQPVLIRGDYTKQGDRVERRYLEALMPEGKSFDSHGSGRRALAELLASPANPLTARVIVNRVWQWVFGAGLVRTPDDFGHLGDLPSHPELLDYLAEQFVADGWSIKKLVRTLALTRAFQSSGAPTAAASEHDPQNFLLSHYTVRRAEAEVIRDSILAVSGRLDPALYGPSIHPYREKTDPERRIFAGPLDGDGRRSIYIKCQFAEAPRFLSAFNLPNGKVAQGRREASNVPAQSLALLNDPFVLAMAGLWGERLAGSSGPAHTPEAEATAAIGDRVATMFQAAFDRPPTEAERARFVGELRRLAELRKAPWGDVPANRVIWKDAAHAIFNFKEFIFIP